jgi:hypothetical protein
MSEAQQTGHTVPDQAHVVSLFWSAANEARFSADVVSIVTGRALDTLAQMRSNGTGPAFFSSGKVIQYRKDDVVKWLDAISVRANNAQEARRLLSVVRGETRVA